MLRFDEVLRAMRAGEVVTREGWLPGSKAALMTAPWGEKAIVILQPEGTQGKWEPDNDDLVAEDWRVIKDPGNWPPVFVEVKDQPSESLVRFLAKRLYHAHWDGLTHILAFENCGQVTQDFWETTAVKALGFIREWAGVEG